MNSQTADEGEMGDIKSECHLSIFRTTRPEKGMRQGWVIATAIASILIMLASPSAAQDNQKASTAEVRKQIETHIAYIQDRFEKMKTLYYAGNAETTLKASFKRAGVSDKVETHNWAGWLSVRWLDAQYFYGNHAGALSESLKTMPNGLFVNQSDAAYLEKGFQEWRQEEQRLQELFVEYVDLYTRSGLLLDRRFALPSGANEEYKRINAEIARVDEIHNRNAAAIKEYQSKRVFEPLKNWKAVPAVSIKETSPATANGIGGLRSSKRPSASDLADATRLVRQAARLRQRAAAREAEAHRNERLMRGWQRRVDYARQTAERARQNAKRFPKDAKFWEGVAADNDKLAAERLKEVEKYRAEAEKQRLNAAELRQQAQQLELKATQLRLG